MDTDDGDDSQTAIAQLIRWQTLSKLLSFATVPLVYGRYDGDGGDDNECVDAQGQWRDDCVLCGLAHPCDC